MASKAADRIKALQQQRAAALAPQPAPAPAAPAAPAPTAERPDVADVQAHFGGLLDQVIGNRQIQRIPVGHIAPDLRPEMRQPRLLPLPETLLQDGAPAPLYAALVAELRELGRSLSVQQIQPIVVYPGTSDDYPAARYLILVGQRRWTAACLVGLAALDAVVVDPPSPTDRVRIQYAENEDREEFSDMERAWSLQQMKQALGGAPWEAVEERLQMSRARRHQLTRMLAFSPHQQQLVASLRLQETQLRPLHTAARSQELSEPQIDGILKRLAEIAAVRAVQPAGDDPDAPQQGGRRGIDGPTIARLVARARRSAAVASAPTPRWVAPLHDQIGRLRQAAQRATGRADALNPHDAGALAVAVQQLRADLDRLAAALSAQGEDVAE